MISSSNRFVLGAACCWASIICFGLGMWFPIMSTKFSVSILVLDCEAFRVVDTVKLFWNSEEHLLAAVVAVFVIVLPIYKYFELLSRTLPFRIMTRLFIVPVPDKWSMLDVFLVAVLLVNFKMNSNFVVMQTMAGVGWLALSIVLRLLAAALLDLNALKQGSPIPVNHRDRRP